ncbi:MAG: DUF502 domain-containing protein [Candidatus Zixiibacteriota bacterium]
MDTEPTESRRIGRQILKSVQRTFVSGIVVTVPIIVTWFVLSFLFRTLDGILKPLLARLAGREVPGLGLIATIVVIFLVGILVRNVIGSRVVGFGELLFVRTPLVRTVYSAAKQLVEAVASPTRKSYTRAVLIEYPRKGIYMVGFASGRTRLEDGTSSETLVAVYLPSTPTPVTGWVVLVPAAEIIDLGMSTEDAIKYVVSGGFAAPPAMVRSRPGTVEA